MQFTLFQTSTLLFSYETVTFTHRVYCVIIVKDKVKQEFMLLTRCLVIIESIKTTSMEDVSTKVLEKIKNI